MQADLYIIDESFKESVEMPAGDLSSRLSIFYEDLNFIIKNHSDDNTVYINKSIYNIPFYQNYTISDLISDRALTCSIFGGDFYKTLSTIITKPVQTNYTKEEFIEFIPQHSIDQCFGIIAFNYVEFLDESQQIVIQSKNDWYKFRRHFLSIYPLDGEHFISECSKYFPRLYFHSRNKTVVNTILRECAKKIIFHLEALNNHFHLEALDAQNRTEVLKKFSQIAHLDEIASLEGNPFKKWKFTFNFKNHEGKDEKVCCEPHLKLCYSDNSMAYSNKRRIYFHEGKVNIENGKILIGHMGSHL